VVIDLDADIRFKTSNERPRGWRRKTRNLCGWPTSFTTKNRSRPGTLIYPSRLILRNGPVERSLIWHRQRRFSAREHDRPVVLGIAVRKLSPAWLLFDAQFMPAAHKPFADMAEFFKVVSIGQLRLKPTPSCCAQTAGRDARLLIAPGRLLRTSGAHAKRVEPVSEKKQWQP